jgi:hypothetical protein
MPLNLSGIPNRSPESLAYHTELYKRSLDTWRVHNPTDKDYIVYNDRRVTNERWIVPAQTKDIGKGKGNQDVPMFIMRRYLNQMGNELIQEKIRQDWDTKKENYRLEERGMMEERFALRSNDPKLWDDVTPLLVKGIVSRYGGEDIFEEPESSKPENHGKSMAEQALDRLGLEDTELNTAQSKEDLIEQIG